jgi:hypothetical protein
MAVRFLRSRPRSHARLKIDASHKNAKMSFDHVHVNRMRSPTQFPQECRNGSLRSRIKSFERAATEATDAQVMASKISETSDRKKYDFCCGLKNDLMNTRAALRACSNDSGICTFGELFSYTGGRIANLNRILQNLKSAREVRFEPECFFMGVHNDEVIELLGQFWNEEYTVDEVSVFRNGLTPTDVPDNDRRGRSYIKENLTTKDVFHCFTCSKRVQAKDRITIRASVYHIKCVFCVVCESSPRRNADYITFDGQICCGSDCIRQYDASHVRQARH